MLHCSCMRQPNQTICLQNKKYAQLGLASIRIGCKRDSSLKARVRTWVSNWAHESGAFLTSIYIYIHKLLHVGLPDQSNDPHSCRDRKCSSRVSNITEICWSFNLANHWKAPFWKNAGTHSADIHNLHVRQKPWNAPMRRFIFPASSRHIWIAEVSWFSYLFIHQKMVENPRVTDEQNGAVITEDEAALYDRQIRLWGLDAQKRLEISNVCRQDSFKLIFESFCAVCCWKFRAKLC